MARGGRPRLSAAQQQSRRFTVRLLAAEWDTLTCDAADAGLSVSEYIRTRALGKRVIARPAPVPQMNRDAYEELARTAANLNQLTRAVHLGQVSPELALVLQQLAEEVRALRLNLLGLSRGQGDAAERGLPQDSSAEEAPEVRA